MSSETPTTQPPIPFTPHQPAPILVQQAPPPRAFRRGFGLGAGAGLGAGLILLVLTAVGAVVTAAIGGAVTAAMNQAGPRSDLATVWGDDGASAANTIRAIPISGPIMADGGDGLSFGAATYGYEIARTIDAVKTEDAAGIVLLVNTPGGSINGSRAIADAVERYQARSGKKVVAFVRGMSASGGMYAMAGSDRIIADHGSLVGSIGVVLGPLTHFKDVTAIGSTLLQPGVTTRGGITQEYLTQGEGKDFGNPFREMTAKERQRFLAGMANEYSAFVDWVSKHRGIPADVIRSDIGAYIYDAKTAIEKRLIDAVMGPEEAFRDTATLMGLDPDAARVAQAKEPGLMEQLLGAEARVYGYQAELPAGATATSVLCTGALQPMLWHGPVTAVCGR